MTPKRPLPEEQRFWSIFWDDNGAPRKEVSSSIEKSAKIATVFLLEYWAENLNGVEEEMPDHVMLEDEITEALCDVIIAAALRKGEVSAPTRIQYHGYRGDNGP